MDDKKKIIFTIIASLAGLFLLTTRFCLPTLKDNTVLREKYRQLKEQVEIMTGLSQEEIDSLGQRLETSISKLEQRFPRQDKLNLVEQLTQVPQGANIVFTGLTQRKPQDSVDYQLLPVEVSAKVRFYDLIKYLTDIDSGTLLIGLDTLELRRPSLEAESLDVKATFTAFRLTHQFPPASKYLQEVYSPIDQQRLAELLAPIKPRDSQSALAALGQYNPFAAAKVNQPRQQSQFSGQAQQIAPEALSLKGVVRIANKKVALINDSVVREGEKIGGMEVVEIRDYQVILSQSGRKYILKMGVGDEFIKH